MQFVVIKALISFFYFMFKEWRRGLYELISNGIHGNIKKDNVITTLSEVTVSNIFIFICHNFYSKTMIILI